MSILSGGHGRSLAILRWGGEHGTSWGSWSACASFWGPQSRLLGGRGLQSSTLPRSMIRRLGMLTTRMTIPVLSASQPLSFALWIPTRGGGMKDKAKKDALREEDESAKPAGPNDASAPVEGATVVSDADLYLAIYAELPDKHKAKFAANFQKNQPEQIAAARKKRREQIRFRLTLLVVVGILADAAAALIVVVWTKSASWDTVKDWLAYALAPLVAAATVAYGFWFPSKEAD
jgi:hypothetical protein